MELYCVLTIEQDGRAWTGIYTERAPTAFGRIIQTCISGPVSPKDMQRWVAYDPAGQIAYSIMEERAKRFLEELLRPRINDPAATRLVVRALVDDRLDLQGPWQPAVIPAIKALRDYCGCGLKEAKDRVDEVVRGLAAGGVIAACTERSLAAAV